MASASTNPSYRPDIDGLRAIAVAAVVLFHAAPQLLPGGFSGVDIFFVISGFLITLIIRREIEEGRFDFWAFYARRIRRIYPALIVVMVVTLAAGYFLVLPEDFGNLADSARWASVGLSNFYFWSQVGYFAPVAERMPLLHTWSLGVEEQFYLVWPMLLVLVLPLLRRMRIPGVALVALVIATSLGYAASIAIRDPDQLFYSPLARAWELALGGAVAFLPALKWRLARELLAMAGAALIALALAGPLQGGLSQMLAASVGAALLVAPPGPGRTVPSRLLMLGPLVMLGLISYSAYLWHWPLLSLFRHYFRFGADLTMLEYLLGAAVLVAVSTASWAFVERPFRTWRAPSLPTVGWGLAASALIVAVASLAVDGRPNRFSPDVLHYLSTEFTRNNSQNPPGSNCFLQQADAANGTPYTEDLCITIDKDRPNVLLVGDSHSNQFIGALRETYPEINFSQASASGCYSLQDDYGSAYCKQASARIYTEYLDKYAFDAVIFSARWRDNPRIRRLRSSVEYVQARDIKVFVLGPNAEFRTDLPSLLAYGELHGRDIASDFLVIDPIHLAENAMKEALGPVADGVYFSVLQLMCVDNDCPATTPNDEPMLQDENHLSEPGALLVMQRLRREGLMQALL